MKGLTVYLCLPLLLTSIQASAQTTSLRAVIDTNNSQIVENIAPNQAPSLSVIPGSLFPLTTNFAPITQVRAADFRDWSSQIGQPVTVDSKQRDLSYTGKLLAIEQQNNTFTLLADNKTLVLPINDFYLIPNNTKSIERSPLPQYPSAVSYQSNELSWSPKRTLIFSNGLVSLVNSAELHNAATHSISLKNSLLHYSPSNQVRAKVQQSALRMSEDSRVDYADNEVTFPLHSAHLKANSDTLIKLIRQQSIIDKSEHRVNIYTSLNSTGRIPLTFSSVLTFRLSADAFPGQYQTFWQRDGLLIPSNHTQINIARAKHPIEVTTNKSLDISGYLTLIDETSQKLPTTQTWEITLRNHSDKEKSYRIRQSMHGVISQIVGENIQKINASGVQIEGEIQPQSSKTILYKVSLKE